jgi:hypothetical protein
MPPTAVGSMPGSDTSLTGIGSVPGVYVLKTGTDLRIFFKIQGDTITVIDVAKKHSIIASGHIAEGE